MGLLDRPDIWKTLSTTCCGELIGTIEALESGEPSPADIERLRLRFDPDLVTAACVLVAARRAAAGKIDRACTLLADASGVQQATPSVVARHKAMRVAAAGVGDVIDLCCGIGGDAIEFAAAGIACIGVDHSETRCIMATHNAGIEAECADVINVDHRGKFVHLDPARRDESTGRRHHQFSAYAPGPEYIETILGETAGAAVKLGPGIDPHELPSDIAMDLEFISLSGTLTQAVAWTGTLAESESRRTATMLPAGHSISGVPDFPPYDDCDSPPGWIFEPDPSIERAELLHEVCQRHDLTELHPGLGMLAGAANAASPWLRSFDVIADMPWRESKVRSWLREHNAGVVEVKTRGKAVDPTPLQRALRGKGDEPYSVLIYRLGTHVHAYICQRV